MAKQVFQFNEPAVGTDGEFFLIGENGVPCSSIGIIGGEKGDPVLCEGGGYLEDCVAVEINPRPATFSEGKEVFANNIISCIEEVRAKIAPLNLKVDISPAQLFPKSQLSCRAANLSGCSPSYNAWTRERITPVDLAATQWRFASGDLHLSWNQLEDKMERREEKLLAVKIIDVAMVCAEVMLSEPNERRYGYGRPGICRPTPYGVEYKSASNFWMGSRELMEWAFLVGRWTINKVLYYRDERRTGVYDRYQRHVERIKDAWVKGDAGAYYSHIEAPTIPSSAFEK